MNSFDIKELPRELTANNISDVINVYLNATKEVPLSIRSETLLSFMKQLKRDKVGTGPYPKVTLFEAANRIMTDLTILYGVKMLLKGAIPEISFTEYFVEYGNDNNNDHDITAENSSIRLIGEAFNVAPSFFQGKKTSSLKKLRSNVNPTDIILLMYNSDAISKSYKPRMKSNEFHLQVDIDFTR